MTAPAAGWYPDPHGTGGTRWWDGGAWTEHAAPPPAPWTPTPAPWNSALTVTAPTGWRRHRFSLLVVLFAAIYLALAITVHIAVLGVLPALMAARAVQAKEPLAGGAVVIAIGTVVLAVAGFAGLWGF